MTDVLNNGTSDGNIMNNMCCMCGKSQSEDGRTLVSGFFTRTGNRFCSHCGIHMSETWLQLSRKAEASALEKLDFLCCNQSIKDPNTLFPDVYLRASDGLLVPAHKHTLARKSGFFEDLFKNLGPTDDVVEVHEMSQSALQPFVMFFYTATVTPQELEKHIVVLLAAAIKFGIHYLRRQCEKFVADRLTHRKLHWAYAIANEAGSPSLKSLCETFVLDRINGKTVLWALDIASKFGSASIRRAALAAVLPSGSGVHATSSIAESQPLLSKVLNPVVEEAAVVGETLTAATLRCSHKRNRSISGGKDVDGGAEGGHFFGEVQDQKKTKIVQVHQDVSQRDAEEEYDSDYYEYSECSSDSDWERHLKPGFEWDFDQALDFSSSSSSSDEESPLETFGTTCAQENSSGSGSGSVSVDDFRKETSS